MNIVYVTGNEQKARYFNKMIGIEIEHRAVEIEEIQDTDIRKVIEHKAKVAFTAIGKPVLVEDTFLYFDAFGLLPGTFIKWFLQELGKEGLCRMLDGHDTRRAIAGAAIAYYDGKILEVFVKEHAGTIATKPLGKTGWGWDPIFIPEGAQKTHGQMSQEDYELSYAKIKPFTEVSVFLKSLNT